MQVSPAVAATARFPLSRYYFLNDDICENHQNRDRIHSYYYSSYAFIFSTQGCRPRHQSLRRKFGNDDRSQVDPSEGAQNRGEEVHIILSATTMHIMIIFRIHRQLLILWAILNIYFPPFSIQGCQSKFDLKSS